MDPKLKNLGKYFATIFLPLIGCIYVVLYVTDMIGERDFFRLVGMAFLVAVIWRSLLSIYRRLIIKPRDVLSYGKWAIVTGSTSGIGKDFANYLAAKGMSLLIISRSENKLIEQADKIKNNYNVPIKYIAYDFGVLGEEKENFYEKLDITLSEIDKQGGIGLLVNNVGTANEIPKRLEELTDEEINGMLNCNIQSVVWMTRYVYKYMKAKNNGAVLSISSGSGNFPAPYLVVYSATKAFMTQFTRSMHLENWDTGVDFLVVTPYYVVSNLFKRKTGTILAPMPIKLIEGSLAQLGKKYIYQGHGYWFHGLVANLASMYWGSMARNLKMMKDNRKRHDERMAKQMKAEKVSKDE